MMIWTGNNIEYRYKSLIHLAENKSQAIISSTLLFRPLRDYAFQEHNKEVSN